MEEMAHPGRQAILCLIDGDLLETGTMSLKTLSDYRPFYKDHLPYSHPDLSSHSGTLLLNFAETIQYNQIRLLTLKSGDNA
jgi:hypothetical protein